jgi:hypothetical protein
MCICGVGGFLDFGRGCESKTKYPKCNLDNEN